MNTYELRPHQEKSIEMLVQSFKTGHKRPLLMAPTGAGKTLVSIDIIKRALNKGNRVVFVVDRITLIDQTAKEFHKHGLDFGVIQGDHPAFDLNKPLQLASIQTLTRRSYKPYCDLLIVDEAHSRHKGLENLMDEWSDVRVVALSATPWTKGLGKIYDDLIIVEDTQGLIDKGYLSDFVMYGSTEINLDGVKTVAGDFNQKELGKRCKETKIVADVVTTWLRRGENRQTLCFAVSVAHSLSIVDEFKQNGVTAEHMDAYTEPEDREMIFKRHNSGETKILSNVGITTKGFDSPNTTCLILARPTKSPMLYWQMVGRVLRVSECGSDAIILDHGKNAQRLGFPTDTVPQVMCNGEKEVSKSKKVEKKEKLPKPCEQCNFMSTEFVCPNCGHVPEKVPNVVAEGGKLEKLERVDMSEKNKWYSMILYYSRQQGHKDGWAAWKYKEKFGVWPAKKTGVHPVKPDDEVSSYIRHLNIKFAKGKTKTEPMDKNNPLDYVHQGYMYSKQKRSDGVEVVRCEKEGKFIGWAKKTTEIMNHVGMKD